MSQNRKHVNCKSRSGSGGVGILVKNDVLNHFKMSMLNDTYEGIMWVQLEEKQTQEKFNVCVCYLPPEGSSRKVNAEEFYDT